MVVYLAEKRQNHLCHLTFFLLRFGVPLVVQTKIYPFLIVNALEVNHTTILECESKYEGTFQENTHTITLKKHQVKVIHIELNWDLMEVGKWLPGGMLIGKSKMCEQRFGMMIIQNQSK